MASHCPATDSLRRHLYLFPTGSWLTRSRHAWNISSASIRKGSTTVSSLHHQSPIVCSRLNNSASRPRMTTNHGRCLTRWSTMRKSSIGNSAFRIALWILSQVRSPDRMNDETIDCFSRWIEQCCGEEIRLGSLVSRIGQISWTCLMLQLFGLSISTVENPLWTSEETERISQLIIIISLLRIVSIRHSRQSMCTCWMLRCVLRHGRSVPSWRIIKPMTAFLFLKCWSDGCRRVRWSIALLIITNFVFFRICREDPVRQKSIGKCHGTKNEIERLPNHRERCWSFSFFVNKHKKRIISTRWDVSFFSSSLCHCRKLIMVTPLRAQVLTHYKKLLRTAQAVFQNDPARIASKLDFATAHILSSCVLL